MGLKKRIGSLVVALAVAISMTTYMSFADSTFVDVSSDHPYYESIHKAYSEGITSGVGGGRFSPDTLATMNQLAVMLCRLHNVETSGNDHIAKVYHKGWFDMYECAIGPDANVTRYSLYASVMKSFGIKAYSEFALGTGDSMNDTYLGYAKTHGLLDQNLPDDGYVTRGEVVDLMIRLKNSNIEWTQPDIIDKYNIVIEGNEDSYDTILMMIRFVPEEILADFEKTGWKIEVGSSAIYRYQEQYGVLAAGLCDYSRKTLSFNAGTSVLHEFGHYLSYRIGNSSKIRELYNEEKNGAYMGDYSKTNPAEFFAEFFQSYIFTKNDTENMNELRSDYPKTFEYVSNLEANNWGL